MSSGKDRFAAWLVSSWLVDALLWVVSPITRLGNHLATLQLASLLGVRIRFEHLVGQHSVNRVYPEDGDA